MWQPITSAPSDGSPILSYGWMGGTEGYRYRVTQWTDNCWTDWGVHTPSYWIALPDFPVVDSHE